MSSSRSSILFLVLCFGCGGTAAVDRQYADMKAEHQDAKTQLTEAGAKLEQKQYPPGKAWRVDLTGQQITDETFSAMDKLGPVSELLLSGTNLSDEHAAAINESGIGFFLLILDVSDTEFSDAGLAQITGGKYMQELNVKGSKVTAEGIKQFKQTHPGISVIE